MEASSRCVKVELGQPEAETQGCAKVRVVVISDTHNEHGPNYLKIPEGDILVHCGDFTHKSDWRGLKEGEVPQSLHKFNEFLGTLPHEHKIVIAGNHEIGFNNLKRREIRQLLSNATYIEDQTVVVKGIRFYGSPWTSSTNMAFSARRSKLGEKWAKIPNDTDILITHLPPFGVLDQAWVGSPPKDTPREVCEVCGKVHPSHTHWGHQELLRRVVEEIRPKAHLFGHVHDTPGTRAIEGVTFINAATHLSHKTHYFDYYVRPS